MFSDTTVDIFENVVVMAAPPGKTTDAEIHQKDCGKGIYNIPERIRRVWEKVGYLAKNDLSDHC